ncbi:NUDIX hydrolase [Candidatus Poriferisodalis sp.]|uniref:NUDIX hydrolase n=1 Tax=Candidatus Poriferisodalis sp. TaxID=3101277 RepID=UPI003B5173B1
MAQNRPGSSKKRSLEGDRKRAPRTVEKKLDQRAAPERPQEAIAKKPMKPRRRHVERGRYANAPVDRAAGGVVCHKGAVLVVHRPRYDDWSLPKGHLDPGESWEEAALREVREETGVRCAITSAPYPVSYLIGSQIPKLVLFYAMAPTKVPKRLTGDPSEVDEVVWWDIADAVRALTYESEREACSVLTIPHLRRTASAAG